jgi:hypothetical protein
VRGWCLPQHSAQQHDAAEDYPERRPEAPPVRLWHAPVGSRRHQMTTKLAYGFRTYEHGEIALVHRLGKLPEPPWMTHRFT